jgi:hypothetical protein
MMNKSEIAQTLGLSQAEATLLVALAAEQTMSACGDASPRALTVAKHRLMKRGLLDGHQPRRIGQDARGPRYAWQGGRLSSRGRALGLAAVDLGWPIPESRAARPGT